MNIKKELHQVLTVKNLIKYGYYQIPKHKPETEWYGSIDAVNTNLFNLDDFYQWVEDKNIRNTYKIDFRRSTEPIEFTIQKSGLTRRLYKYPNLYSYLMISSYVEEKKISLPIYWQKINILHRNFSILATTLKIQKI